MSIIDTILGKNKPIIWRKFLSLKNRPLPVATNKPEDAYRMGLQAGYGEGLTDGVDIGLDVGMYTRSYASVSSFSEPFDIC